MQKSSMWKLAALAAVVALGFFAVFQTQRGLQDETPTEVGSLTDQSDAADEAAGKRPPVTEKQVRIAQSEPKTAPLNNPFDDPNLDARPKPGATKATAVSFPKSTGDGTAGLGDGGQRFDSGFSRAVQNPGISSAVQKSMQRLEPRKVGEAKHKSLGSFDANSPGIDGPAGATAKTGKPDNPFGGDAIEDGFQSKSKKTDSAKTAAKAKSPVPKFDFGSVVEPKPPAAKTDGSSRPVFGNTVDPAKTAAKSDANPFRSGDKPEPRGTAAKQGTTPKVDTAASSGAGNPFGTLPDDDKGTGGAKVSGGPSLTGAATGKPAAVPKKASAADNPFGTDGPIVSRSEPKPKAKTAADDSKVSKADTPNQGNPFARTKDTPEPKGPTSADSLLNPPTKGIVKSVPLDSGKPPESLFGPSPAKTAASEPKSATPAKGTPFPDAGKQDDSVPLKVAAPEPKAKSPVRTTEPPRLMPLPIGAHVSSSANSPKPTAKAATVVDVPRTEVKSQPQPQAPQVTIQKTAPRNAVLGKPFIYDIVIKNIGGTAAHQVVIHDPIPSGVRLEGTDPQAFLARNNLVWKLGSLSAGSSRKISVKVTPVRAGQIGSVATVNFVADAATKPAVVQPKLMFHMEGPQRAKLGDKVSFKFTISNVGSEVAKDVWLRDVIPDGLKHPAGDDLEYKIGTLAPGKTETISLAMTVAKSGTLTNRATITAAGGVRIEAKSAVSVSAQKLVITRTGPSRRIIGRPAVYQNMVTNGSTETVTNATLVEAIPAGMDFVAASGGGKFDAARRTVAWSLGPLAAGKSKTVQLQLLPRQAGVQNSVVQATGTDGSTVQTASATKVVGYAALGVDMAAVDRPVNIGEQVTLRVIARNRGTSASSKVQLKIALPAQLTLVSVRGPGKYTVADGTITFDTLDTLAGQQRTVYDLTVKAVAQGDSRVKVQIQSAEMSKPLHREEAVLVLPPSP